MAGEVADVDELVSSLPLLIEKADAQTALEEHYEEILDAADANGIDDEAKAELKEELDTALAEIEAAEDSDAVDQALEEGILTLDKTEGNGILDGYLARNPEVSDAVKEIITTAKGEVDEVLIGGDIADSEEAGAAIDEIVSEALKEAAKQELEEHYKDILENAEANGIDEDGIAQIEKAYNEAVEAIDKAEGVAAVEGALEDGILGFDQAEGGAILDDYLKDKLAEGGNTETLNKVVDAAKDKIEAVAIGEGEDQYDDNEAAGAAIDEIVKNAMLDLDKQAAKDQIGAAADVLEELIDKIPDGSLPSNEKEQIKNELQGIVNDANDKINDVTEGTKDQLPGIVKDALDKIEQIYTGTEGEGGILDEVVDSIVEDINGVLDMEGPFTSDDLAAIDEVIDNFDKLPESVKNEVGKKFPNIPIRDQLNDKLLDAIKDVAEDEYKQACDVVGVEPDADVINTINGAESVDDVYDAFEKGIEDLISGLADEANDSDELNKIVADALEDLVPEINNAEPNHRIPDLANGTDGLIDKVKDAIDNQRDAEKQAAKDEVQKHYDEIMQDADQNGITADGKAEIENALNDALDAIDNAETSAAVDKAAEDGILNLDKAEGGAILDGYLEDMIEAGGDSATLEKIVENAKGEIDAVEIGGDIADNDAAGAAIDEIVENAKLELSQETAKDIIEEAAGETTNEKIQAIVDKYTKEPDGIIDAQKTPEEVETELDRALAEIRLEEAREELQEALGNSYPDSIDEVIDQAIADLAEDKTSEEIEETLNNALDTVYKDVVDDIVDAFHKKYDELLNKKPDELTEEDLGTLDEALDYIEDAATPVQDALKEEYENLSDKYKEVAKDKLEEIFDEIAGTDTYPSDELEDILSGYLEEIDNVTPDANDPIRDAIDAIVAEAEDALTLQKQKDDAKAEYIDAFEAVNGREPTTAERADVFDAIDSAADLAGVNDALKDGVKDLVNGLFADSTSEEFDAILNGALDSIDAAVETGNGTNAVADVAEIVAEAKENSDLQKLKDQAKAEYAKAYEAANGTAPTEEQAKDIYDAIQAADDLDGINTELAEGVKDLINGLLPEGASEEAKTLVEEQKNAVGEEAGNATVGGVVADVADLVEKIDAKLDVQEKYEEILEAANENGIDNAGKNEIKDVLEDALNNIDFAENSDAIDQAAEDGILALDKAEGEAILDAELSKYPGASEEIDQIISDAKDAIAGVVIGGDITDNEAAGAAIDEIVENAKLELAKENAKDEIEAVAGSKPWSETIDKIVNNAFDKIESAQTEDEVKAIKDQAIADINDAVESDPTLVQDALDKFVEQFDELVNKPAEDITADDLDQINEALDIIENAPDAVKEAINEHYKDVVDDVASDLTEKQLEAIKDGAVSEYEEAYEAIFGAEAEPSQDVIDAINGATSADGVYDKLQKAVNDLVDGLVDENDSDELKEIAQEYKDLIDREFVDAEATATIPDVADTAEKLVEQAKEAIEAQREAEKAAAQEELKDHYEELKEIAAENGVTDLTELDEILNDAQDAIDNAETSTAVEEAKDQGIADLDNALLPLIKDAAEDKINAAADEINGFIDAIEDELMPEEKKDALKQDVQDIVDAATGAISDPNATIDSIQAAVDEALDAIDAIYEANEDLYGALADKFEEEYDDVINGTPSEIVSENGGTQGALDAIEEALDALDQFSDPVKNHEDMDAIRDKLLHNKQEIMKDALEDLKDDLNGADSVIDDYIDELDKVIAGLEAEDHTALDDEKINDTLDDLFEEAQDAARFEDYKNDAIDTVLGMVGEGDSDEIFSIADSAASAIDGIEYDPDRFFDEQTDAIDDIVSSAADSIAFQGVKDDAKKEYEEICEAGGASVSGSVLDAIQNAGSIKDANDILAEAAKDIADDLLNAGDSDAAKAIVEEAKELIESTADRSTGRGSIADLDNILKDLEEDLAAQREKEKEDAKKRLDEALEEAKDSLLGSLSEAEDIISSAKDAIDDAAFDEYPLIIGTAEGKLDILEYYEEQLKAAEDAGMTGTDGLTSAKDQAVSAVDGAESTDDLPGAIDEGILIIDKAVGVITVENMLESDDGEKVRDIIADGAAQIGSAGSKEEIDRIIDEVSKKVEAARVEQDLGTDIDIGEITAGDIGALEDALDKYEQMDEEMRELLDKTAQEEGYTGFPGKVEDLIAKSEFEAEKDKVLDAVNDMLREHDGEYVQDILGEQLDKIGSVDYEAQFSDEERQEYLENLKQQLEEALKTAEDEITHAQEQQRAENQLIEDIEEKLASGKYDEEQKQKLEDILAEAQEQIRDVPAGSTDAEKEEANAKLEEILNEMLDRLDNSPVSGVSVGDIKPDKSPSVEGGTGDYEDGHDGPVWGIVTNDKGMPGSVQLVIEETENDRLSEIESAAKNDGLVAAEGSDLTAEEMADLVAKKDIKCTLDIYLLANGVIITEFDGFYRIMVLLPTDMRDMSGLQVVYVDDDGSVQVYETTIEDGMYLVFTTAHFSEFYILGDTELNLWWLIILLAVILVIELILIVWLVVQRGDKKKSQTTTYSFAPAAGLLAVVLVPSGAIAACIVLGILVIAAGIAIAVLLLKKDRPEDAKGESQQTDESK